jgi:predicted nucleic acid-binding protein
VTSAISLVEVAYAKQEKDGRAPSAAVDAQITKLWVSPSPVMVAEFHPLIAADARTLIREAMVGGRSLKPNDAIHLATARSLGIRVVETYDRRLLTLSEISGLKIREPLLPQGMLDLRDSPR